jgi:hypothetical protein
LAIAAFVFAAPPSLSQEPAVPLEYQVKAAFLLNFTRFVEWPPEVFAAPDSPVTICIQGRDPFGSTLDQIVEGETVGERKVAVERVRRAPSAGCHVLFISDPDRSPSAARVGSGHGVLTVGEGEQFVRQGGIVSFVVDNRRVRFEINYRASTKAGIKISSRLLAIARTVLK